MEKSLSKPKRDIQADVIRAIACIIVVCTHINNPAQFNNDTMLLSYIRKGFFGDGVTIFWMLCGFFLFKTKSVSKLWKRVVTKIMIPVIFLYIFDLFFAKKFWHNYSISYCFTHAYLKKFLHPILEGSVPGSCLVAHTWYVADYIILMIFFPLLNLLVKWLDKSNVRQIIYLAITFAITIANDISDNRILKLEFLNWVGILAAANLVIWGHIIYQHKDLFTKKWLGFLGLIGYFVLNIIRGSLLTYETNIGYTEGIYLDWWCSSFSYLCTICIIMFAFGLVPVDWNGGLSKLVILISGLSFGIYLIHPFFQQFFINHNAFVNIIAFTSSRFTVLSIILGMILSVALLFTVSAVTIWIIQLLKKSIKKIFVK